MIAVPKEIIEDIKRIGVENCALSVTFEVLNVPKQERDGHVVTTILKGFEILPEIQQPES